VCQYDLRCAAAHLPKPPRICLLAPRSLLTPQLWFYLCVKSTCVCSHGKRGYPNLRLVCCNLAPLSIRCPLPSLWAPWLLFIHPHATDLCVQIISRGSKSTVQSIFATFLCNHAILFLRSLHKMSRNIIWVTTEVITGIDRLSDRTVCHFRRPWVTLKGITADLLTYARIICLTETKFGTVTRTGGGVFLAASHAPSQEGGSPALPIYYRISTYADTPWPRATNFIIYTNPSMWQTCFYGRASSRNLNVWAPAPHFWNP